MIGRPPFPTTPAALTPTVLSRGARHPGGLVHRLHRRRRPGHARRPRRSSNRPTTDRPGPARVVAKFAAQRDGSLGLGPAQRLPSARTPLLRRTGAIHPGPGAARLRQLVRPRTRPSSSSSRKPSTSTRPSTRCSASTSTAPSSSSSRQRGSTPPGGNIPASPPSTGSPASTVRPAATTWPPSPAPAGSRCATCSATPSPRTNAISASNFPTASMRH